MSLLSATSRAEPAVSAATRGLSFNSRMILRHWPSAITWLSTDLMRLQRRTLRRHQLIADRQEPFGDDVQLRGRHQMMDVGDAAGDRILDRDHAEIDLAVGQRSETILEGRAGHRLVVRIGLAAGDVRIRPRFSLENDLFLAPYAYPFCRRLGRRPRTSSQPASILRAFSNSSGVSTPSGTLATTATSMRMPASSARNCSSFSRLRRPMAAT